MGTWGCSSCLKYYLRSSAARGIKKSGTYASTVNSIQLASPYPKLLHCASALQAALQAAKVFLVPELSK